MRMRTLSLAACLLFAPVLAIASADGHVATGPADPAAITLDSLYDRLTAAKTQEEADAIATMLDRFRLRSGSDTADLLMSRALTATQAGDNALAIEILSTIIKMRPDFTEAWNKRATLLFMENDYPRSMADIAETLKREPRHFGAWAGLGMILSQTGDKKRAYDAFQHALAINPHMDQIRKLVDGMKLDVEGQGI